MGRELTWRIERNRGQNYIEIEKKDNIFHTTLGLGDGIISLLFITASLFNIDDLDVILIDEPELSLHPEIQKRVMKKILEISQNKQIIIATHSPYFIDFDILINGGKIYRCINTGNVNIRSVSEDTIDFIKSCKKNIFNPHILGLDAKEIFFLDDNVILVEGQEDVILFNNYILPSYPDISINVTFFGWGTGGNHNSPKIAKLLYELGYEKVAIVLDECHDYEEIKREISEFASEYYTDKIPAMDIRKSKTIGDTEYLGLLDEDDEYNIRDEYKSDTHKLLTGLSTYFE